MHADLNRNYKLKKILFQHMNNTYEFLSHLYPLWLMRGPFIVPSC